MDFKEKELLVTNRIIHNVGDIATINGNAYYLDCADASGNSAPIGWLFARQYTKKESPKFHMIVTEHFMDNNVQLEPIGAVMGAVNRFTGKFIQVFECIPNIENKGQIVALYHEMFPRLTLIQKIKKLLAKLLNKE